MEKIVIHDVGLRDGLQMEKETVPFETKIQWAESLMNAGIDIIQLGSFVHPVKVPQMADTDELFNFFRQQYPDSKTIFSGLVLNEKGLERGLACGVEMFCMGVSASETHSKKNTGMTTDEALGRIISMAKDAEAEGKKVQVSVQSAFGCGFEGKIKEHRVFSIVEKYLEEGIKMISLADTAGYAYPQQVERMFSKISQLDASVALACHFHNTYGLGLANVKAAMDSGAVNFESAFGGLGGCPFTKLAAGNVCTEDMVHFLQRDKIRKDINLEELVNLSENVSGYFNRELPGYVYRAGIIKY